VHRLPQRHRAVGRGGSAPGAGLRAGHPRRGGAFLPRLPRRKPRSGAGWGRRGRHGRGLQAQPVSQDADARRDPRRLRALPLRRHVHEALQPRPACRSGAGVLDQPARQGPAARRRGGRHLRRLPRRSRHPERGQPALAGLPHARGRDVQGLSRRRPADAGAAASRRPRPARRPVRALATQRPRPVAARARRPAASATGARRSCSGRAQSRPASRTTRRCWRTRERRAVPPATRRPRRRRSSRGLTC
jgi:hypothetical protein